VEFTALYCMLPDRRQQGDGFGVGFEWDVPLLEGYDYEVLRNASRSPSVTAFGGCDTPGIAGVIRRRRLDALVVNGWVVRSCLQALQACRRMDVPCLVRGEANLLRPRPWWKRAAHRRLVRQYAGCLYIGRANRHFYERHGVGTPRLFPAPYCVDNRRFGERAAEGDTRVAELRRGLGIPEDATSFLFSGKLIPKKHPLELLQAFRALAGAVGCVHLLIAGDGELRPACEAYAAAHRLPVSFAGFLNQSQIAEAYLAADCLVLPSDHGETWGLVVNEAMACGRPAIVSDQVGCAADLIVEHETGRTFSFGDWSELAERMAELAGGRRRLRQMGETAKRHIAAYSPEAAADGITRAAHTVTRNGRVG
jgi:glycosyltransferase involved in cell wall biosynthesis